VADYSWPIAGSRTTIGTDVTRIDTPLKVTGRAAYTTDVQAPGMLYAVTVGCPYAHAKIISIDTSAAEKVPGCKAVTVIQKPGTEIFWAGDDVVAIGTTGCQSRESAIQRIAASRARCQSAPS